MICVVIGRTRHKMVQIEIQEAAKRGAQLIELRLDFLAKAPDFKRLLADKPCPMVATVRRPAGRRPLGRHRGRTAACCCARPSSPASTGSIWRPTSPTTSAASRTSSASSATTTCARCRPTWKRSHERMCRQDADVVKIAVRAQQPADNLRVLRLAQEAPKPTVAFCMGDMGLPSRILGAEVRRALHLCRLQQGARHRPGPAVLRRAEARIYHYDRDQRRHTRSSASSAIRWRTASVR